MVTSFAPVVAQVKVTLSPEEIVDGLAVNEEIVGIVAANVDAELQPISMMQMSVTATPLTFVAS
jgi:hypothetical protein